MASTAKEASTATDAGTVVEAADAAAGDRPRLRIGIVGVGRAGSVLGAALARAGHRVTAAHAVSDVSRLRAEALLPGVPLVSAADAVTGVDLALITVPDDALTAVIHGLVVAGSFTRGQLVAHASGRHGIGVLAEATALGAGPIAMHPAMTLTGTSLDLKRLAGAPFGITSTAAIRPIAEALVVEMGGEPIWVPEDQRVLYHAALANGANYLVTQVTQSIDLLAAAGIDHPERIIAPLLSAALDNALRYGDQALTGPVARGDAETVAAHIKAIAAVSPEAAAAYVALGRLTADRAMHAGLLRADAAEGLLDVLAASTGTGAGTDS